MGIHWQTIWQKTRNGPVPVFRFDSEHELIGTFLATDVQRNPARMMREVEAVRNGERSAAEVTGNVCSVLIGTERVLVLDMLAKDGIGKGCALETGVFLRILHAWDQALQHAGDSA